MPGIGLNTEIHYFDDLYRHYPTILSDNGSDTDPILTAGSDGKQVAQFGHTSSSGVNAESGFQYEIKHLEHGSDTGENDGIQEVDEIQIKIEYEFPDTSGILGGSGADIQVLTCQNNVGTGVFNCRWVSDTDLRVFVAGESPTNQTIDCSSVLTGNDVSSGIHTLEVYYKTSSGSNDGEFVLWIDGNEVSTDFSTHDNTDEIGIVQFYMQVKASITGSDTPKMDARKFKVRCGNLTDSSTQMLFFDDASILKPWGLLHFGDRTDTSVNVCIHDLPGRNGWSNLYAKLLYAEGTVWPGDESATESTSGQLTQAGLWVTWKQITGLTSGADVMVKVVCGDDVSYTNSWTSGVYSIKLLQNTESSSSLSVPIEAFPLYCHKNYGRAQGGTFDIIQNNLPSNADIMCMILEDEIYSDDREPDSTNSAVYPLDVNAAPDYQSTIPAGLGWGIMSCQAGTWRTEEFSNLFGSTSNYRCGPSDHVWDNSWNPAWSGLGTSPGGQWGSLTRSEIHARGITFLQSVQAAGMDIIPTQGPTEFWRSKKVGPLLFVWLDVFLHETGTSKLGATQKAWLLDLLESTDAKHVLLMSGQPVFDIVYKNNQDWAADSDHRDERDEIMQEIEDNSAIESCIWLVGDAHLAWWYPNPDSNYPKCLGEFAGGASSSTMIVNNSLDLDRDTLTEIQGLLDAHGGGGWVEGNGQQIDDGTHQRMFGRMTYDTDGSLTIRLYDANVDHDDLDGVEDSWDSKVLQTINLTAFTPSSGGTVPPFFPVFMMTKGPNRKREYRRLR